jgi:hypothetical protein
MSFLTILYLTNNTSIQIFQNLLTVLQLEATFIQIAIIQCPALISFPFLFLFRINNFWGFISFNL